MATARVLIVDDEPSVLRLVSKAIAGWGYEVHAASGALQALKLAHDDPCFDLIISDVIMPEMCGPELVRRLSRLCPNASVVMMSANIAAEVLPAKAAFISKPFTMADLRSVVDRALSPSS
jgi:two-component system response regulator GlrR